MINQKKLINSFFTGIFDFTILQGAITLVVVLTAHRILSLLHIPMTQLSIFRYSVLSAFYILFVNYFVIVLYYFDDKKRAMLINLTFLGTNIFFTIYSVKLGFDYYGMGLFISSVITFVFAGFLTFDYIKNLPYHTFITKNKKSKY
jgi:polysaccharide biosynthesis protein PelG